MGYCTIIAAFRPVSGESLLPASNPDFMQTAMRCEDSILILLTSVPSLGLKRTFGSVATGPPTAATQTPLLAFLTRDNASYRAVANFEFAGRSLHARTEKSSNLPLAAGGSGV
jgi:hypothetical protein